MSEMDIAERKQRKKIKFNFIDWYIYKILYTRCNYINIMISDDIYWVPSGVKVNCKIDDLIEP
jgi:hypothetical protein